MHIIKHGTTQAKKREKIFFIFIKKLATARLGLLLSFYLMDNITKTNTNASDDGNGSARTTITQAASSFSFSQMNASEILAFFNDDTRATRQRLARLSLVNISDDEARRLKNAFRDFKRVLNSCEIVRDGTSYHLTATAKLSARDTLRACVKVVRKCFNYSITTSDEQSDDGNGSFSFSFSKL